MTDGQNKTAKIYAEFASKMVSEIENFTQSKSEQIIVLNLIVGLITETKAKVIYLPDRLSAFMNQVS